MKEIRSILVSVLMLLAICYYADKATCTTYAKGEYVEFTSDFTFSDGSNLNSSENSLARQNESGASNATYRIYTPQWAVSTFEHILKTQLHFDPEFVYTQNINTRVDYYRILLYPFHEFS